MRCDYLFSSPLFASIISINYQERNLGCFWYLTLLVFNKPSVCGKVSLERLEKGSLYNSIKGPCAPAPTPPQTPADHMAWPQGADNGEAGGGGGGGGFNVGDQVDNFPRGLVRVEQASPSLLSSPLPTAAMKGFVSKRCMFFHRKG